MSRVTRNKSDAPKKSGSPMLTGILLGMVFGVALAAGLAWYLLKSPSPFVTKEQAVRPAAEAQKSAEPVKPAEPAKPAVAAPATAAVTAPAEEAKPRFEFYKVLTDKPNATSSAAAMPKPAENKAASAPFTPTYLQVGSFSTPDGAEGMKAKLAMKGFESSVLVAKSPDGAEWHRVRVGPFRSEKELSDTRATLKQMGVEATPIR